MKQITVGINDSGQRLDRFLTKLLPDAPKSLVYKWLRKKRVKVNGKRTEISYMLCEGDVLELYINDEFFKEKVKRDVKAPSQDGAVLKVVYEDKNILIADKPSGLSAHDGEGCLLELIQGYLYDKGEYSPEDENTFAPALCNRIDRNTSGLVLAAKNAAALRGINEKIRNREIKKYYLLKTEGQISPPSGIIEGYTKKNEKERRVYFYKTEVAGSKYSATAYRSLDNDGTVEAELITGRTHQIRASFAYMGCPLKGDVKYGAKKDGRRDFQQLHAYKLKFDFTTPSGELEYLNGKVIETKKPF